MSEDQKSDLPEKQAKTAKPAEAEKKTAETKIAIKKPPESVDGSPLTVDMNGGVHCSAKFFNDPHVRLQDGGTVEVRRIEEQSYIVLQPGQHAMIRTGVKIYSDILGWRGLPTIPGEVLVTDIQIDSEEIIVIVRPFGGQLATLKSGDALVEVQLS